MRPASAHRNRARLVPELSRRRKGAGRAVQALQGRRSLHPVRLPVPGEKAQHFPGVVFHTSIANRIPMVGKFYRSLFPICPFLIEQFDVTEYDAVISSSAAYARGVLTRPDQPHLCYVHSPVRYAWDEQFSYFEQGHLGFGPKGLLFRYLMHRLRQWDVRTAHGPDLMFANSNYVRARIRRIYGPTLRSSSRPSMLTRSSSRRQGRLLRDGLISRALQAHRPRHRAFNAMPRDDCLSSATASKRPSCGRWPAPM